MGFRYGLVIDDSRDLRPMWEQICSALGGKPDVVSRPTGAGGHDDNGNPLATAVVPDEINFYCDQGVLYLPYYNDSRLNGGTTPSRAQGTFEGLEACQQMRAVGIPAGCYFVVDIENKTKSGQVITTTGEYLSGLTSVVRDSEFAGSGILYSVRSVIDPGFAQAAMDENVQRMLRWNAAWRGDAFTLQDVEAGRIKWEADDLHPSVVMVQKVGEKGPMGVDMGLIRLPLPEPGRLCGQAA